MISILILLAVAVYVISVYNGLVVARQRVNEAWSTIDTQLKRRYDLIPNLLETVKGYKQYEKTTFEAIVNARNAAMNATSVDVKGKAEQALSGSLKSLFALSESYPALKADATGAYITRHPQALASALDSSTQMACACVCNPLKKIGGLLDTHPSVQERVRRLQSMTHFY